jgi:hypothetical protein
MSDVAEDEHVVAAARLVGAAEPNEPEPSRLNEPGGGDPNRPEPNGRGPNEPEPFRLNVPGGNPSRPEPNRFGSNEPGAGEPNEPESCDDRGQTPDGADHG